MIDFVDQRGRRRKFDQALSTFTRGATPSFAQPIDLMAGGTQGSGHRRAHGTRMQNSKLHRDDSTDISSVPRLGDSRGVKTEALSLE